MADESDRRGRSPFSSFFSRKSKIGRSSSNVSPNRLVRVRSGSDASARSASPGPLRNDSEVDTDVESTSSGGITPQNAYDTEEDGSDGEDEDEDEYEEQDLEPSQIITFRNTAYNTGDRPVMNILESQSQLPPVQDDHPNMLEGEQPVFFVPNASPEKPHFQPTRAKSKMRKEEIPLTVSPPIFERNRCTITIDHGDWEKAAAESRRTRTYLAASDLSTESSYAIEWCIGTVLRDGDTAMVVSVIETDSKLDPDFISESPDNSLPNRNQRDREEQASILAQQVTALLKRTRLRVRVTCQAIHAKNDKHMLVDMIDYTEPTLVIIGSRGLNKIKGMLLGSVSYYLVQKSSVPVMVARRRLQRTTKTRKSMATLSRQARVPLSQAETEVESHGAIVQHEADKRRTLQEISQEDEEERQEGNELKRSAST